jgi:hypothetical protein
MTVILSGQRSDGTPLVLVRCDCCLWVVWLTRSWCRRGDPYACRLCGHRAPVIWQPTLAQATAPQEAA